MRARKLIWIVLVTSILLLLPSIANRIDNENKNKNVILAGNISGNTSIFNDIATNKFKASGIYYLIIPWVTIRSEPLRLFRYFSSQSTVLLSK